MKNTWRYANFCGLKQWKILFPGHLFFSHLKKEFLMIIFASISDFQRHLQKNGFTVSKTFIQNVFQDWKWSWKKPDEKQPQKYTMENLNYYITYLSAIQDIPLKKLFFFRWMPFWSSEVRKKKSYWTSRTNCSSSLSKLWPKFNVFNDTDDFAEFQFCQTVCSCYSNK